MTKRSDVSKRGHEFDRPAMLDDKNIVVVDEVRVSSNTLEIAKQFLAKAFPSSKITALHWMRPKIGVSEGTRFNSDVPIWYSDKTALGRGIGDINQAANEQARQVRIRRGNKFFSRALEREDPSSAGLRRDIREIFDEIASGKLPLRFNLNGISEEELNNRLEFMKTVNCGVDARTLTSIIHTADGDSAKFLQLYEAAKAAVAA